MQYSVNHQQFPMLINVKPDPLISHIFFIDTVTYSKRIITAQNLRWRQSPVVDYDFINDAVEFK